MNKIDYKNTNFLKTILGPFPDETILAGADRILKIMEPNFKDSNDSLKVLLSPQYSSYDTSVTHQSLTSESVGKITSHKNQSKSDMSEITVFETNPKLFEKQSDDVKLLNKLSEIENSRKDMIINKIKQSPINSEVPAKIIEKIDEKNLKLEKLSDEINERKRKENSKKRRSKIPVLISKETYKKENKIKLKETLFGETEVNIYEDNSRIFQIGKSKKEIENGEAFIYAMLEDGSSACFQILSID